MNKLRVLFFLLLGFAMLSLSVVAQDGFPKKITGGILNGKATSLPKPAYPEEARAAGLEGTVYVNIVIDESGTVESAVALTTTHTVTRMNGDQPYEVEIPPADPSLREAAERAALEARFAPTVLSGQPVKVSGTIVYNFVARKAMDEVPSNLDGGILNEKAISLPKPAYPPAARAVKACGPVSVGVTVDENGDVISSRAISGHPLLRSAAVEAARAAKFTPTALSGQLVKVSGILTYNFEISEETGCSR